ncbi:MAG: 2-dehydropantoate 2-reductase [Thermodesulfobacteriota bacterium]
MHDAMIIGPGAVGCLLAARLCRSGRRVILVDRDPERAANLAEHGILLVEPDGSTFHARVAASVMAAVTAPPPVVFLCVKSMGVAAALGQLRPLLSPASTVVALQNGIGHLDALAELAPRSCTVAGVTAGGAHSTGVGQVVAAGAGITTIGAYPRNASCHPGRIETVAAMLRAAGLETETVDDVLGPVWDKLLVNVGINALTALLGCRNGELLENPWAREVMAAAVAEGERVARTLGIGISADPLARTVAVCRATSANISSMLQDVRRRRPTEIEAINGAVVRLGREHGIPVAVNEMLARRVIALEQGLATH